MSNTSFIRMIENKGWDALRCQFTATHFGPHAGYAQQYLFHYMRTNLE